MKKWKPKHARPIILMWKGLQIAARNCKITQVLCKKYSSDLNLFIEVLDNSMKNYVNRMPADELVPGVNRWSANIKLTIWNGDGCAFHESKLSDL